MMKLLLTAALGLVLLTPALADDAQERDARHDVVMGAAVIMVYHQRCASVPSTVFQFALAILSSMENQERQRVVRLVEHAAELRGKEVFCELTKPSIEQIEAAPQGHMK